MNIPLKSLAVAALMAFATPVAAECFADYKASQGNPLQLHYGVMQVSDDACATGNAEREVRQRLKSAGWKLLNVMAVFGPEGLGERKASAGEYFLRF